jgi:predicted nucleotidyltransferase
MASDPTSVENIRAECERIFQGKIDFIFLIGSAGTEKFTPESDIDLAAYFSKVPPREFLQESIRDLENTTSREVDLIMLNSADPIIAKKMLRCPTPFCQKWTDTSKSYPSISGIKESGTFLRYLGFG